MAAWRREALKLFPFVRMMQSEIGSVKELWLTVSDKLVTAHREGQTDQELVAASFEFAEWCLRHGTNEDATSAVQYFYEALIERAHDAIHEDADLRLSRKFVSLLGWKYFLRYRVRAKEFADYTCQQYEAEMKVAKRSMLLLTAKAKAHAKSVGRRARAKSQLSVG